MAAKDKAIMADVPDCTYIEPRIEIIEVVVALRSVRARDHPRIRGAAPLPQPNATGYRGPSPHTHRPRVASQPYRL